MSWPAFYDACFAELKLRWRTQLHSLRDVRKPPTKSISMAMLKRVKFVTSLSDRMRYAISIGGVWEGKVPLQRLSPKWLQKKKGPAWSTLEMHRHAWCTCINYLRNCVGTLRARRPIRVKKPGSYSINPHAVASCGVIRLERITISPTKHKALQQLFTYIQYHRDGLCMFNFTFMLDVSPRVSLGTRPFIHGSINFIC